MSEYNIQMNKYNALNADYDQLYPKPMKHANTHANGGTDPITPSDIGAYSKNETDTLLAGKAPAGYGLGMNANSSIYDADNITAFGFYTAKTNTPTNDWCTILNIPYGQNRATQFSTLGEAVSANKYSYCKREKIDGIWKPWEWVNPRMELGVEYRTTERYQEKPVYVKAFNTGALGQNAIDDVFVDTPNADNIWVASGTFINTSGGGATPTSIPYHASADDNIVFASAYSGVIHRVYKGSAYTITNMIVVLKYTKSTD